MYNHAPADYICPFCLFAEGIEDAPVLSRAADIVYHDAEVMAILSIHWWLNNPGHAVVIPRAHYENIYDLPIELSTRIHEVSRSLALAMKKGYGCDGVSTRQHNEPAGNQDVWHYHMHVFPRYVDDGLYGGHKHFIEPDERACYAQKLRPFL